MAGDPFEFRFEFYNMLNTDYDINIMFHLIDDYDNLIFIGSTVLTNLKFRATKGYIQTSCRIPENLLNHGKFTISKLYVLQGFEKVLYEHTNLLVFEITGDVEYEKERAARLTEL